MPDPPSPRRPADDPRRPAKDPPPYRLYRSGPRMLGGKAGSAVGATLARLRRPRAPAPPGPGPREARPRRRGLRGPLSWKRALAWFAAALLTWIGLSMLLFLISAQTQQGSVSASAKRALDSGGLLPFSSQNILVLGSDLRPKGSHERGASTSGPSRSDVLMLIRTGGGAGARLSIPRDTVVDVPGLGVHKINAAYAFGGAALAIRTVRHLLGIPINHVVELNFTNFPQFVDAMGGVDYTGGCVYSRIDGGYSRGGITLRLKRGDHHLNGKQALALARTRHNLCHPGESDLTRVKRQQALFAALKSRILSLSGFIRLPFISWAAPKALQSDMGGPTLLGVLSSLAWGGTGNTRLLTPSGVASADGGVGLTVSRSEIHRAVAQFQGG